MNNQDKIYAGSAKIVQTNYGELTKVSFHKDDINKMVQYMKDTNSDWINLAVKAKQSPQPGKPTHYLEVDTWKPKEQAQQPAQAKTTLAQDMEDDGDTLPF